MNLQKNVQTLFQKAASTVHKTVRQHLAATLDWVELDRKTMLDRSGIRVTVYYQQSQDSILIKVTKSDNSEQTIMLPLSLV